MNKCKEINVRYNNKIKRIHLKNKGKLMKKKINKEMNEKIN